MKSTQKKLKRKQSRDLSKRFRYLTKEEVHDPTRYIRFHYGSHDQESWQEEVYVFLTSGSTYGRPPLRNPYFVHKHLINHIDVAYLLLKYNVVKGSAQRLAKSVFELNSRDNWVEMFDELLRNEVDSNYVHDQDNFSLLLVNFVEHMHYLVRYFYLVNKGMADQFSLPLYIMNYHSLPEEERSQAQELKCIPSTQNTGENMSFYHKERVSLPEWLMPQPFSQKAVQDFFSIDRIEGWKSQLWHWYQSVITEDIYWCADNRHYSGATLLHNYACIYSLLEMYRIQTSGPARHHYTFNDQNPRSIFAEQQTTCAIHDDSPVVFHYVSLEEMDDPMAVIIALVGTYSLAEWEEILYDWLSLGLSKNAFTDERYSPHASRVYQLLVKIIELSYVLAYKDELRYPTTTKAQNS